MMRQRKQKHTHNDGYRSPKLRLLSNPNKSPYGLDDIYPRRVRFTLKDLVDGDSKLHENYFWLYAFCFALFIYGFIALLMAFGA